jgi:hypothetical protein
MTSRRRHPAQASRILATGLSTATLLGIVAILGAQPPTDAPVEPTGIAPAKVTVVIGNPRTNLSARRATARPAARQATARRPDTSTHPS